MGKGKTGGMLVLHMFAVLAACAAAAPQPAPRAFTVPLMSGAPTLDGDLSAGEWAEAAGFDGMTWKGTLEQRSARIFIGATTDTFYFAVASELPLDGQLQAAVQGNDAASLIQDDAVEVFIDPTPDAADGVRYQFVSNILGAHAYEARVRGAATECPDWKGACSFKHARRKGEWITEIKVPLRAIAPGRVATDGVWSIGLCRDWKAPWTFTGAPGNYTGADTRIVVRKGAPAIQFRRGNAFHAGSVEGELSIRNTAPHRVALDVHMGVDLDVMPSVRVDREVTLAAGQTRVIPFNATRNARNCGAFDLSVHVAEAGVTRYDRRYRWRATDVPRWSALDVVVPPFDFEFAYYPYRNRIRVRNLLSGCRQNLSRPITYLVREREDGSVVSTFTAEPTNGLVTTAELPELDGEYEIAMVINGEESSKAFTRRRYAWENNLLGRSRTVYPPFTPMTVAGRCVGTVFREHELADNGLPGQIRIKGTELLAAPIRFRLRVAGKEETFAGTLRFTEKAGDVVRTEIDLASPGCRASANGRWEYDGCLRYDLTLASSHGKRIDELTLDIPFKAAHAPMYHAIGDGIRNTQFNVLPEGQGEIWNAAGIGVNLMPANFCTYMYVGSPVRGLCVFAENDKGWSWNRTQPNMSVHRQGDTVTLRVHLITSPTVIDAARTLTFGLLAAPVKPRMKNWRTVWETERLRLLGTCVNWLGGPGNCANVYPPGRDEFFFRMIARGLTVPVPKAEMQACAERAYPYFETYPDGETARERFRHHVFANLGGRLRGTRAIFYYNRAIFNDLEEYRTFMNEWSLVDFPSRTYVPSLGEIKIVPSESYNDFALHWYLKSFELGGNNGVYWDNWFFQPSFNTAMTDACVRGDSVSPAAGMWDLRDLSRRTFQMMCEKGMPPLTFPHMTSTAILPMLSFATIQYDWEWKYSTGDVQDRYTRPYTMLVSNGELAGTVPVMLGEHGKEERDEWVQRTFVGVCLTHELISNGAGRVWKTLRDPILKAYASQPDVQVLRYWDDTAVVQCSDDDYAWILYSLPGRKAVLVVCSYKDRDGEVTFALDLPGLGLRNARARNVETGAAQCMEDGTFRLAVRKHGVMAVELVEDGK